jgi:hypothetical protein
MSLNHLVTCANCNNSHCWLLLYTFIFFLLQAGADPCLKDVRGRVPFFLAANKEVMVFEEPFGTFLHAHVSLVLQYLWYCMSA